MAGLGLAHSYLDVRDMDGRNDVYEFPPKWSLGDPSLLDHYDLSGVYESLDTP